ncbi:MAG: hypothetical protein MUD02_02180 [Bacteroidales bacterium]|nr:hypothetical protein [Bacteroidales bacterium]
MARSLFLSGQENRNQPDTLAFSRDTLLTDTLINVMKSSDDAIDMQVVYSATGRRNINFRTKKVTLVESAVVTRDNMEIKADSIVVNMSNNTLFAIGRKDTTGKIAGKPAFKDGEQQFDADEITYNFKSRQAYIRQIVTKQDEGTLQSKFTKLLEDGTSNISKSSYSTCDAETPHFYINLPRAKIYPGEKIVSGPGNLVLEGIPLPLVLPFGFFPINTKRAASGILIPRIGEERERGFYLSEGGYYFALNDYFDLTLKGNIYSNGSWLATAQSSYNKLYKYNGNFSFSYAKNITGHVGLEDYSKAINYRLGWIFNQDQKASPGSRFSASVNLCSSGYDRENSYVVQEHVTTQKQSSISYSKTWDRTPFNLSASMNHSQNAKNKTVSLNLPKVNFSASRITPFKRKNSSGSERWYEQIQFQYTANLDNRVNTTEDELFTGEVWKDMSSGFSHDVPLSLQFRPFRNFSISPSLSYSGVAYTAKTEKRWDPAYYNPDINQVVGTVIKDTIPGFFYGQALKPAISASFNPQIFGDFTPLNANSRIQKIRHVVKPSVGFSYVPYFSGLSSDMYRQVQVDTTGNKYETYSIFEDGIFGTPSLSQKSGNISLGLVNILEAKVFARDDTTGKPKKVKLIENFSINTAYNIFADSMRWAPINLAFRTTLRDNIYLSAGSNFSIYGTDELGRPAAITAYKQDGKLLRLTNFNTSVDFSVSELFTKNAERRKKAESSMAASQSPGQQDTDLIGPQARDQHDHQALQRDRWGYTVFDVPWTMNLSYTFSYYVNGLTPVTSQAVALDGNLTLTKKTSVNYRTGYDFTGKEIAMTSIGVQRDLHCWEMSFNWIPNGTMQSWSFTIRVKASVLGDLKYDRRKDYHDTY